MYAVKANRKYTIEQREADAYRAQGYDIVNEEGKVLHHGAGRIISAAEYERVCEERGAALVKAAKAEAERDEAIEAAAAFRAEYERVCAERSAALEKAAKAEAERDEAMEAAAALRAELEKLKKK